MIPHDQVNDPSALLKRVSLFSFFPKTVAAAFLNVDNS
jgi:hypothetical protein